MINEYDIEIGERSIKTSILVEKDGTLTVQMDDKKYHIDVVRVEEGVYSIILNNRSYEFKVTNGNKNKVYQVMRHCNVWDIELVDAETRYARNRNKGGLENGQNSISSPMPGKVVRIMVTEGQEVEEGETLIVISAMKMESEYKSPRKAVIKEILTNEGETINGHQPLITIE